MTCIYIFDFTIRSRKGLYKSAVNKAEGPGYSAMEAKLLRSKKPGKALYKDFTLNGMPLRLVMARNLARKGKDEIIYLLSNTKKQKVKSCAECCCPCERDWL